MPMHLWKSPDPEHLGVLNTYIQRETHRVIDTLNSSSHRPQFQFAVSALRSFTGFPPPPFAGAHEPKPVSEVNS